LVSDSPPEWTCLEKAKESCGRLDKLVGNFDWLDNPWGQEVGVTPIQLISAVSAIANGGLL